LSLDSAQVRVHLEADDLRGGREEVSALKQNDLNKLQSGIIESNLFKL
jgi:hypothetical protein